MRVYEVRVREKLSVILHYKEYSGIIPDDLRYELETCGSYWVSYSNSYNSELTVSTVLINIDSSFIRKYGFSDEEVVDEGMLSFRNRLVSMIREEKLNKIADDL